MKDFMHNVEKWPNIHERVNPFHASVPFLNPITPQKRQKIFVFLTFSGGIEMGHWHEKG